MFEDWLYGAVDFVIREHLRSRYGRAAKQPSNGAPRVQLTKRDLHSLAGRYEEGEHAKAFLSSVTLTTKLTVAGIFEHVENHFSADEAAAMHLYYREDRDFAEIARQLNLAESSAAERMIRKLNARLRYHFMESDDEPQVGSS